MKSMKKEVFGILIISLIIIMSTSFVSASWFSNFWGKITGNVISSPVCENADLNNDSLVNQDDVDFVISHLYQDLDIDRDNIINAIDKSLLNMKLNGLNYSTACPNCTDSDFDLNGDGINGNAEDKALINQVLNGMAHIPPRGDMNGDDFVNQTDVQIVQGFVGCMEVVIPEPITKLEDSFGCSGNSIVKCTRRFYQGQDEGNWICTENCFCFEVSHVETCQAGLKCKMPGICVQEAPIIPTEIDRCPELTKETISLIATSSENASTEGVNFVTKEGAKVYTNDYVVLKEGFILKLYSIEDYDHSYNLDKIKFTDNQGYNYQASYISSEGKAIINFGLDSYYIAYGGPSGDKYVNITWGANSSYGFTGNEIDNYHCLGVVQEPAPIEPPACVPEWECSLVPAICPQTEIQQRVCIDLSCGSEERITDIICDYTQQCSGCLFNNICFPIGTRKDGEYCSNEKSMKLQKIGDETCSNDYECEVNLCIDNKCINRGIWQRFIDWLKSFIG